MELPKNQVCYFPIFKHSIGSSIIYFYLQPALLMAMFHSNNFTSSKVIRFLSIYMVIGIYLLICILMRYIVNLGSTLDNL